MKQTKLILLFIVIETFSFGQTLQQGVSTTVTLATDVHIGHPVISCYFYEFEFAGNCLPYVTGMDLFLSIDSIAGATDSIQIWRWPDYIMTYLHLHDTIPINTTNSIYVYYLDVDTLYTSLVAIGTPQIAGESYFCNYSKSLQIWVDGCNNLYAWITGGNGALDTVKGCFVLNPTGINETKGGDFEIYPNPVSNNLNVETNSMELSEIKIYDIASRKLLQQKFTNSVSLNTEQLAKGLYLYEVRTKSGLCKKGKVVKD